MGYLVFGFAIGLLVCGFIEKFHKQEQTSWIKPSYLFLLSAIGFAIFILLEWVTLKQVVSNIF